MNNGKGSKDNQNDRNEAAPAQIADNGEGKLSGFDQCTPLEITSQRKFLKLIVQLYTPHVGLQVFQ